VRINGTPSGHGVHQRSGKQQGTPRHPEGGHRIGGAVVGIHLVIGGVNDGETILKTLPGGADGV